MLNSRGASDEPTGKYKSVIHGCEIDLPRSANWLVMISPETLSSIQQHPVMGFFSEHIKHIQDGMMRQAFFRELADHPFTQHANEMFVKLGAMFGKTEIWAGIFAAASNGFLLLGHDGDQEADKNVENPSDSIEQESTEAEKDDDDDGPQRCKRYFRVNKKKLLQMEVVVNEKSKQIAALALALGPEEFNRRRENIKTQLTSMEENLKAQQAKKRVSEMLSKLDNDKTNVAMNKRGEDIPPRLLGYFQYNHLRKRVNVNELKKELDCRGVENWTIKDGPTKGLKILKTVEKKRFEETVEKALTDRGKTFVGLLITKKLTRLDDIMKTNEESTNGELNMDFGKFFKKQATNLDVTIFEET
jgi:hypothetical protein